MPGQRSKHEEVFGDSFLGAKQTVCICLYIYIYARPPPPQDLRFRDSWGMGRTKHCNAQKNPKFPTLKRTKHCNAQKIPKFWHLWPGRREIL